MIEFLTIDKTPVQDLERRFNYMLIIHNFSFEKKLGKLNNLPEALQYPFNDLPIYDRLKELIKQSTVFPLRTLEDYIKFAAINHLPTTLFKQQDIDLIIYFNEKLLNFLEIRFPNEYKTFIESLINRLKPAFWFDRDTPHWLDNEKNNLFLNAYYS